MIPRIGFILILAFFAATLASPAGDAASDDERFRLLSTRRTSTLQRELYEAGNAGYVIVDTWPEGTEELFALLERSEQQLSLEYQLLATLQLDTLRDELSSFAHQGYRLVPRAVFRNPSVSSNEGEEIVVVIEKSPGDNQFYEYAIFAAASDYRYFSDTGTFSGTLDREPLKEALICLYQEGFSPAAMVSRSWDVDRSEWLLGRPTKRVQNVIFGEKLAGSGAAGHRTDLHARYRVIAGTGGKLQEELSQAADDGFRLLLTSTLAVPELVLVMEKGDEHSGIYEYLLLGSSEPRALENQMNGAGDRGYQLYPGAVWDRPLMVLMERSPVEPADHEYSVLQTNRTSTLVTEIEENHAKGFSPVGGAQANKHLVITEKRAERVADVPTPASPKVTVGGSRKVVTIETRKISTMQEELNENAAQGFRILAASTVDEDPYGSELTLTLQEQGDPSVTYEYIVMATNATSKMEKELNEAARDGFRMLPGTVLLKRTMFRGVELVTMAEKPSEPETIYEYLVLAAMRGSTLEKEIAEAAAQGYEVVARVDRGEKVAFLERPVQN